jgi:hypothetical protein
MFFRNEDEQLLRKVLAADVADGKKLQKMERDLEALRPKWLQLQEQAEILCSRYANNDRSYARGIYEPFWRAREEWFRSEIDKIAAERDALTATLPGEISALKAAIHQRCSLVAGDFASWVSAISTHLTHVAGYDPAGATELRTLVSELETARTAIGKMTDLASIVEAVQKSIDRAAECNVSLLNVGATIRKLAS